jgi:hypothetical protein
MVVSLGSALMAPSVKLLPRNAPCETFGRLQPTPEKVNETGTLVSERVHVREIVVISGLDCLLGQSGAFRVVACRSPMAPI